MANLLNTIVNNHLQIGTAASDTTNLRLDVQGNMAIRGSNGLYFGVSTNNYNSWSTKIYASGSTQYFNAQQFIFDNQGYVNQPQTFASFSSQEALFRTYSPDLNYKISIIGGDQFNAYYGSSGTTMYINYHNNVGSDVYISGTKFKFESGAHKLVIRKGSGTMISHDSMSDAFGYNTSYGTYIGSPVGGTYYIYGNGTFYDNGTVRTLIHTGNIGSQSVNYASSAGSAGVATYARRIAGPERIGFNVGGEASRFYPIAIYTGAGATSEQYSEFIIERGGYEDPGYSGIGFSTFNARFTYKPNGWGYQANYFNLEQLSQTTAMLGDYLDQYHSSQAIIWLRGATRYNIYSVYGGITLLFANESGTSYSMAYGTYDPIDSPSAKASVTKYYEGSVRHTGSIFSGDGVQAPIFYDSNDTGYYLDPNGTSNLNNVTARGLLRVFNYDSPYGAGWDSAIDIGSTSSGEVNGNYPTYINNGYGVNIRQNSDGMFLGLVSYDGGGNFHSVIGWGDDAGENLYFRFNNSNKASLDYAGNFTAVGDVTAYSDARIKTNVKTIESALDKTLKLRGVTYTRTDSDDTSTKVGVIAQEILQVIPEVVNENKDGIYSVSYGNLTAVLIEAIKEQQAQINELKAKLDGITK